MTEAVTAPDPALQDFLAVVGYMIEEAREGLAFEHTPYTHHWQFSLCWGEIHNRLVTLTERWVARIIVEYEDMAAQMTATIARVFERWYKLTFLGSAVAVDYVLYYDLRKDVLNLLDCMGSALKFGMSTTNRRWFIDLTNRWLHAIDADLYMLNVHKKSIVGSDIAPLIEGDDVALALIDAALRAQSGEYVDLVLSDIQKVFVVGLPERHVLAPCRYKDEIYHLPISFDKAVLVAKERLS